MLWLLLLFGLGLAGGYAMVRLVRPAVRPPPPPQSPQLQRAHYLIKALNPRIQHCPRLDEEAARRAQIWLKHGCKIAHPAEGLRYAEVGWPLYVTPRFIASTAPYHYWATRRYRYYGVYVGPGCVYYGCRTREIIGVNVDVRRLGCGVSIERDVALYVLSYSC